ncbi:MAG: hypothetical protein ACK463_31935, partial [Bradyrhizobium sp.]
AAVWRSADLSFASWRGRPIEAALIVPNAFTASAFEHADVPARLHAEHGPDQLRLPAAAAQLGRQLFDLFVLRTYCTHQTRPVRHES